MFPTGRRNTNGHARGPDRGSPLVPGRPLREGTPARRPAVRRKAAVKITEVRVIVTCPARN